MPNHRRQRRIALAAILGLAGVALCGLPATGLAQTNDKTDKDDKTDKSEKPEKAGKLPRFASLRSSEVNVRTGPGPRYPVDWVMTRRNMPVEIVAEHETWRRIRDWQNTEGWVHQALLSAQRHVLVTGDSIQALLRRPDAGAPVVAQAEPGVVAQLLQCEQEWCRIQVARVSGWIRRRAVWGVYPDEDLK